MDQPLPFGEVDDVLEPRPGEEPIGGSPPAVMPVDDEGLREPDARASGRRRRDRTAKNLTAEQRVLRARLGAYRLHATHDPKETTKKAREAFASRFERQVDPDGVLAPIERARRAEAARRAYFTRLALRSSQARRRAV
jgi:hypothetical protein